jgi:hypothetical protein
VSGGFGAFARAIEADIDRRFCGIRIGQHDLRVDFTPGTPGTFRVAGITAGGETFTVEHYFWCATLPPVLKELGIHVRAGPPQQVVLGDFVFDKDLESGYHEILVGSKAHAINRISFPGLIAGAGGNLLQTEFYFPEGEFPVDAAFISRCRSSTSGRRTSTA